MSQLTEQQVAQVQQEFQNTMMAQQQQMLEIAGKNALEIVLGQQQRGAPSLLDTIDEEIQQTRDSEHNWKSNVNERNYSNLKQIEQMWRRTERFVQVLEVGAEQETLKTGALSFIEKGKKLTHDRLKLLRFADRDGWTAALNYLGDQIAETEAEAKAMRKGKKEADRFRETRKNFGGRE